MSDGRDGRLPWATVGAYERDNFGDLLLYLVTQEYLADAGYSVLPTTPFVTPADLHPLLGVEPRPWPAALHEQAVDVVWTVGGAVGAVGLGRAWKMSSDERAWSQYQQADGERRDELRRAAVGGVDVAQAEPAYLPRLSRLARQCATVSVANSIGFTGFAALPDKAKRPIVEALEEASIVSVRDKESVDVCRQLGVPVTLAPDLVHTVRERHDVPDGLEPGVVLQASEAFVHKFGLRPLVDSLASCPAVREHGVTVLCAGVARGHDSPATAAELVDALTQAGVDATASTERSPYALVDLLASARLFVGTSLHGRVVSCAYDVPRVGLANAKVATYSRCWDPAMPHGVNVADVPDAVENALAQTGDAAAPGARLAAEADRNMRELIARAAATSRHEAAARRLELVERRHDQQLRDTLDAWAASLRDATTRQQDALVAAGGRAAPSGDATRAERRRDG